MAKKQDDSADFNVLDGGSVFIVTPQNDHAAAWLDENVGSDLTWGPRGIVVEPRYIENLVVGIQNDGFTVEVVR